MDEKVIAETLLQLNLQGIISGIGRAFDVIHCVVAGIEAVAERRRASVEPGVGRCELAQSHRLIGETGGGRRRIGQQINGARPREIRALTADIGDLEHQIIHEFPFHAKAPLLDLRIAQILLNRRTDGAEVVRCAAQFSYRGRSRLLNDGGSGNQIGKAVPPDEIRNASDAPRITEGRQETLIGDGVQENEIVSDAVAAADDRLVISKRPVSETYPWCPVVIVVERRFSGLEQTQGAGSGCTKSCVIIQIQIGNEPGGFRRASGELQPNPQVYRKFPVNLPVVLQKSKGVFYPVLPMRNCRIAGYTC